MKRFIHVLSLALVAALLFPSCASIFTKNSYPVTVSSIPDGAEVKIYNKSNVLVYSGVTPANTVLKASKSYMSREIYVIKVGKEGYAPYEYILESKLEGWYFGNIFLGGLLGMLIIDPLTGSMYKITDRDITVDLGAPCDGADNVVNVTTLDQVPEEMRASLEKLN